MRERVKREREVWREGDVREEREGVREGETWKEEDRRGREKGMTEGGKSRQRGKERERR